MLNPRDEPENKKEQIVFTEIVPNLKDSGGSRVVEREGKPADDGLVWLGYLHLPLNKVSLG